RRAHRPAVALAAVLHAGDLLAQLDHRLRPQVLDPLGDPAAALDRLDAVAPGRVVEVHHRDLERERPPRLRLDDLALRGPLVLAVAVVAVEGGADLRAVEALVPLAGVALLGPLPHAGHVRDGGVHLLGRGSDVA